MNYNQCHLITEESEAASGTATSWAPKIKLFIEYFSKFQSKDHFLFFTFEKLTRSLHGFAQGPRNEITSPERLKTALIITVVDFKFKNLVIYICIFPFFSNVSASTSLGMRSQIGGDKRTCSNQAEQGR